MTAAPARFTLRAEREFLDALAAIENAAAAARLRQKVNEVTRHLGRRPAMGRQNLQLAEARYRFWSCVPFPYLLVYRTDVRPVSVVRFLHTSRDLPRALADLRMTDGEPEEP